MNRVFISYHYDDPGEALADAVGSLVKSHGFGVSTGQNLMGHGLTDGIRDRVDNSVAAICLLTKRADGVDNQWVVSERVYAQSRDIPVFTVIDHTLTPPAGMFSEREHLRYDPDELAPLLLDLSIRLGELRRTVGRRIKAFIEPEDAAALARNRQIAKTQYRCIDENYNELHDWHDAPSAPCESGVIANLPNVADHALVQLKVQDNTGQTWESNYVSQSLRIRLEKVG